jgi:hypothetical protein
MAGGEVAEFGLPGGAVEGPRLGDIRIDPLANHEEFLVGGGDGAEGGAEIVEEEDVAVDVAEDIVPRNLLSLGEHVVEPLGAELTALDVRLVAEAEFAGDFRGAFIGAEENDFDFGMEAGPRLDGVALDDADVPFEGFPRGEEGKHVVRIPETLERLNVGTSQRWNVEERSFTPPPRRIQDRRASSHV